jgi:hypothetical protein
MELFVQPEENHSFHKGAAYMPPPFFYFLFGSDVPAACRALFTLPLDGGGLGGVKKLLSSSPQSPPIKGGEDRYTLLLARAALSGPH